MKKTILFLLLLAGLSALSGFLMSEMSWIGRVGINLMHKEYKFLKVWWQGAAVVYGVLLVLFGIQSVLHRAANIWVARLLHVVFLAGAVGGLYITNADFSDDFSHNLLKQRFHMGAYLFWGGWMLISLFFLAKKQKKAPLVTDAGSKARADQ